MGTCRVLALEPTDDYFYPSTVEAATARQEGPCRMSSIINTQRNTRERELHCVLPHILWPLARYSSPTDPTLVLLGKMKFDWMD